MALTIFQATAIYKATSYVFNDPNNVIDINATEIDGFSPRNAWLLRNLVPGSNQVQYQITFQPSSADLADVNTIQGLYLEQGSFGGSMGVLIDCTSITDFNLTANGTQANLTRRYGAAPAFTTPTAANWCITRSDDGSAAAHGDVSTDYLGFYVGNVRLKSNISGTSIYAVTAYGTMKAIGSDSVAIC